MAAHRTLTCSCCGKVIDLDHYDIRKPSVKQMVQQNVCFECLFWKTYIDNPIAGTYIVNGKLMYFVPIRGWLRKSTRLKKGIVYVRDMKTGEAVANMERQIIGTVPPTFKELLPDRYKFISLDVYERIHERQSEYCMMKGCYDRYHCLWYNPEIAEPDGPWNEVSSKHKVGDELCESFINKNTMYDV